MRNFRFLLVAIVVLLGFVGCNNDGPDPDYNPTVLVNYEKVENSSFSIKTISDLLTGLGYGNFANSFNYEIDIYKITYNTEFIDGKVITASGIVAVPISSKRKDEFPILSYQHGTLLTKSSAPSINIGSVSTTSEAMLLALASTGMVVVIPDYIGFGESADEFHPYMINQYGVSAVLDMLRAVDELFIKVAPCKLNDKLYMFGYSQGATVTMATLSELYSNSKYSEYKKPTMVSCGSGVYDLAAMREWIMDQPVYDQPYYLAYMAESYNSYVDTAINQALIFSDEFAGSLSDMFNGETDESAINNSFGTFHVGETYNDDFENDESFATMDKFAPLRKAFNENKIDAWQLDKATSLRLYYGGDDDWIPGEQSVALMKAFEEEIVVAAGEELNVESKGFYSNDIPLNGDADHANTFFPTVVNTVEWFLNDSEE